MHCWEQRDGSEGDGENRRLQGVCLWVWCVFVLVKVCGEMLLVCRMSCTCVRVCVLLHTVPVYMYKCVYVLGEGVRE